MLVTFDKPALLLLAIILLPLLIHGWRSTIGMDRMRRILILFFRSSLTLALCAILAGPHIRQQHNHLTVIGLLDTSGSVRRFAKLPEIPELGRSANIEYLRRWLREATETKAPDDRFGLVVFDGDAIAISAPTKGDYVDDNLDVTMHEGTNIAQAVSLGLAMFPADTAKRLVLISDGNETSGDLLAAARQAAGGSGLKVQQFDLDRLRIPIDILPITYTVTGDVQVVRVEAPPNARPGQTVTVRIILEATEPTEGSLTLLREGRPNDINGRKPGYSRQVFLAPGQSVHLAQVVLGNTPINRFEAIFEASDPTTDIFVANNRAEAFTATPAKGTVLVVDRMAGQQSNYLVDLLNAADIPSSAQSPEQFPLDLLTMQAYDLNKAVRGRTGRSGALSVTVPGLGAYEAADGWIWGYVGTPAGAPWPELLKWMEEEGKAEDLTQEPYRSTAEQLNMAFLTKLMLNPEEGKEKAPLLQHINEVLQRFFAGKTKRELYEQGQGRRLLIGIVSAPDDLAENRQLNARDW
ncbi:MAG: VWA domain-containing protein, partial [Planctomycetes bacterium]|nr:VWA domain-containing protein [Planctomycetota bacterium]